MKQLRIFEISFADYKYWIAAFNPIQAVWLWYQMGFYPLEDSTDSSDDIKEIPKKEWDSWHLEDVDNPEDRISFTQVVASFNGKPDIIGSNEEKQY